MTTKIEGKELGLQMVDVETLLAPISVEQLSGEWLRYTGTYDAIEDARREEDPHLPRGVWQRDLKRADWNRVELVCLEALETRSKDLQIAAWLLEAWVHLIGIAGAVRGLKLLTGLCESFWEDVHPQLEGDDVEARISPFRWLNEKGVFALRHVLMTFPEREGEASYSWGDWEQALYLANQDRADHADASGGEEKGKVTRDKFLVGVSLTKSEYYLKLADDIQQALDGLGELERLLERKLSELAPSLSLFGGQLERMQSLVAHLLEERTVNTQANDSVESLDTEDDIHAMPEGLDRETQHALAGGSIASRADAYRRLWEAAEYLQRTEPHSPAPYLVKRAVAWGGMPLGDVLQELISDDVDLRTAYKLLGIKD